MPPAGTIELILDAYVVRRGAVVVRGLRGPAHREIIVGHTSTILGPLEGGRNVHLARAAHVRGAVSAAVDVVVGAQCVVEGTVTAGADVLVLEGARITGGIRAGGRVRIIGATVEGLVEAGGDVEVRAPALVYNLRSGGRVRSLPEPVELVVATAEADPVPMAPALTQLPPSCTVIEPVPILVHHEG